MIINSKLESLQAQLLNLQLEMQSIRNEMATRAKLGELEPRAHKLECENANSFSSTATENSSYFFSTRAQLYGVSRAPAQLATTMRIWMYYFYMQVESSSFSPPRAPVTRKLEPQNNRSQGTEHNNNNDDDTGQEEAGRRQTKERKGKRQPDKESQREH